MQKRFYTFLNSNNILYNLQFGFRQHYSTSHALINITENIRKALDKGNIGCGVFLSIYKRLLILQATMYYQQSWIVMGFVELSVTGLNHICPNRNQYVSINGYDSGLAAISCGVPQGSVLGLLLFLLHINDLNRAITFCQAHHFAGDTNLLCLSNSIKKLNKLVNADFKQLVIWLNANKISLSVKKTGIGDL